MREELKSMASAKPTVWSGIHVAEVRRQDVIAAQPLPTLYLPAWPNSSNASSLHYLGHVARLASAWWVPGRLAGRAASSACRRLALQ